MFTTLNNQMIIKTLQEGRELFIVEYFPPVDSNGTVVAPCDMNGEPLVPILDGIQLGLIPANIQRTRLQKPNYIYSYEEYEGMFKMFYQSIINNFPSNSLPKLSHIGLHKLYESYKYVTETDTIGGLVNIVECSNYISIDSRNRHYINTVKGIPELNAFSVGYKTFCYAVKRMIPEMVNSLTLAGSLSAYNTYKSLFKEGQANTDYKVLDNVTFNQLSAQVDNMLKNVAPDVIRESFKTSTDNPALGMYMQQMIQFGFPSKVAIDMLVYHSTIKHVVLQEVRKKLLLEADQLSAMPVIFDVAATTSQQAAEFRSFL